MNVTEITVRDTVGHDWKARAADARVYVNIKGESILDNLMNRRERPYNVFKKEVMPKVMDHLEATLGIDRKNFKVSWSQYAGCSCPCSPGFILKSQGYQPALKGKHIWACVSE